jgi:hypothetical protein
MTSSFLPQMGCFYFPLVLKQIEIHPPSLLLHKIPYTTRSL